MREHKVEYEGKQHILQYVLGTSPLIKNVSPTSKTDSDGMWNLSTTSELYNEAVLFVNPILGIDNNSSPSNSTIDELDDYHSFLCQSTMTSGSGSSDGFSQKSNESPPIPSKVSPSSKSGNSSVSEVSSLEEVVKNALDDVGKSVDTLKQKVDGRFDQMKVEIFEEIDYKLSKQAADLRIEHDEKTKLAVHASLKLAREDFHEIIRQLRMDFTKEIKDQIQEMTKIISPNPRFRK